MENQVELRLIVRKVDAITLTQQLDSIGRVADVRVRPNVRLLAHFNRGLINTVEVQRNWK